MYEILIVGAGGFGREVFQWSKDTFPADQYRVKGFLARPSDSMAQYGLGVDVVGDADTYTAKENERFLFAIGDVDTKKRMVAGLQSRGARFLTLIHPTAVIAGSARIGEGVIICPFALVSANAVVGDFVALNTYASCAHDSVIGKHSILCPYATVNGWGILEDEVFMGTHSTVTPRIRVGYRAKISANSAVFRDVPSRMLAIGVPAKNCPLADK